MEKHSRHPASSLAFATAPALDPVLPPPGLAKCGPRPVGSPVGSPRSKLARAAADRTARTTHQDARYVIREDGTVLAHHPTIRAKRAGWLVVPAPPSPIQRVWAALAHPRTLDELVAVLPGMTREQIGRLVLELADAGRASHTMTPAGYVMARIDDPSPGEGKVSG